MNDQYFVENAASKYFEEVDKFIYDNWKYVENGEGKCRYTGKRFASVNGEVKIDFTPSKAEMGVVCRMLGITIPQGTFAPVSKVMPKADLLIVKKGNSVIHYDPATGNQFKLMNKKLAA